MADNLVRAKDKPDITTLAAGDIIPVTKLTDSKDYHTTPEEIRTFTESEARESILFDKDADAPAHEEGRIFYDKVHKSLAVYNDDADVTLQVGQESWTRVYNNTGGLLTNGTAVYFNGNHLGATPTIAKAGAADLVGSINFIGLITSDIADGTYGFVTQRGILHNVDTSLLSVVGALFLSATPGETTMTKPAYPNRVVVIGGVLKVDGSAGQILVTPSWELGREGVIKSYSFTSQGISAGTYYVGGFYDAPAADANLSEASLTVAYGTALSARGGHALAVFAGAGSVDAGVVGLRVTGTSITDAGVLTTSDVEVLTADITSLATNQYLETNKKFLGTTTWELYIASGSPTVYSLDFNYGFAKYEDLSNRNFYIDSVEVIGLAGATDTAFNIELLHHKFTGWTYHASAFIPGDGAIESMSADLGAYDNIATAEAFWWKHTEINQFIEGSVDEGIVFRITCGQNNSVQAMDLHMLTSVEPG